MKRREIAIFLTLLALYVFYQRPPLYANRYLYLTYAIVDRGTFNVDVGHRKFTDRSIYEGHYYVAANPGVSFLAVPVYAGVKLLHPLFRPFTDDMHTVNNFFINIIVNNLLVCLTAVFFFRLLGDFGLRGRKQLFLTLVFGLGTIVFCYSLEYFAKATISMFFAFWAFYLMLHGLTEEEYRSPPAWRVVIAGACCAMCLMNGYEHGLFCIVFGLYLLTRLRFSKLVLFGLSAAVCVLPLFVYQKICFGDWMTDYGKYMEIPYHIEALGRGLSAPNPSIIDELTMGLHRGYFAYMPILVLSVVGLAVFAAKRFSIAKFKNIKPALSFISAREILFLLALAAVYIAIMSGTYLWRGGCAFGPRYFVITIPFFLLLATFAFEYREVKMPAFLLGGASLFINWTGVQYDYGHYTAVDYFLRNFFAHGPRSAFTVWLAERLGTPASMSPDVFVSLLTIILLIPLCAVIWLIWKRWGRETAERQ